MFYFKFPSLKSQTKTAVVISLPVLMYWLIISLDSQRELVSDQYHLNDVF